MTSSASVSVDVELTVAHVNTHLQVSCSCYSTRRPVPGGERGTVQHTPKEERTARWYWGETAHFSALLFCIIALYHLHKEQMTAMFDDIEYTTLTISSACSAVHSMHTFLMSEIAWENNTKTTMCEYCIPQCNVLQLHSVITNDLVISPIVFTLLTIFVNYFISVHVIKCFSKLFYIKMFNVILSTTTGFKTSIIKLQ